VNHFVYVLPGYALTLVSIGAYAWWVVRRGRALSPQVPPERRRFLE
jgi:heme exporter protein CcmD